MVPPPVALGLTLCDYIIVEEGTAKISLIGTFTQLGVDSFPSEPKRFFAFVALAGSQGDATIDLVLTQLDSDADLHSEQIQVHFPDKLTEVQIVFEINEWSFPAPGWYQLVLLVDGEWVAQRRLEVYLNEEQT
ncbi:MAG TPA: hypothetical protein VNK04_08975 [Gemmataceae bacterium]|nr:hypothetical protein [Gemmataceae bacterium]